MSEIIVTQGSQGPLGGTGPIGPQGPQGSGVQGPAGPAGNTFPYNVSIADATFTNVGASAIGTFVLNGNGIMANGIQGISFPAITIANVNSYSNYGIDFQNVNGAVAGIHFDSQTTTVFDGPVSFSNVVTGVTANGIGTTGPQGPQGFQGPAGVQGIAGATGGINFPYDVTNGEAIFLNVASTGGLFIINENGIQANNFNSISAFTPVQFTNISASSSYGIEFNNIMGASGGIHIDDLTTTIFDGPVVFNNTVQSTLYDNNNILITEINGGATPSILFDQIHASSSAAIQYSNVSATDYGVWFDSTVQNVLFDCPVQISSELSVDGGGFLGGNFEFESTKFDNSGSTTLINGSVTFFSSLVNSSSFVWVQYKSFSGSFNFATMGTLVVTTQLSGNITVQSYVSGLINTTDNNDIQWWVINY